MSSRDRARRARLWVASVVFILAAVSPTPALAADGGGDVTQLVDQLSRSADPVAAYALLSPADQGAVRDFLTQVSTSDIATLMVEPSGGGTMIAAITTCWTWTWQRDGKNALGATLWSYFQRINWCGNGSTITSTPHGIQRTRWGEVYYPFWQWRHVGNQTWGGVGQQTYRAWTQGEFKLCITGDIGCVQYSYPWLDMTAWADGRGTGSVGG
jgi:hypothetical protein